jgi:uncharacterized protein YggE
MRTITVQGQGKASRNPDRVTLVFTIKSTMQDFADAVEGCVQRTSWIQQAVESVGISRDEIKTAHFEVAAAIEYTAGRSLQVGYTATQRSQVKMALDRKVVGRVLSGIANTQAMPEVAIVFEVSDQEGMMQEVLANAVQSARRRAETIAEASGLKLGPIQQIDYGFTEIRVSSDEGRMACSRRAAMDSIPDIDPAAIEAEDGVTVVWLIE